MLFSPTGKRLLQEQIDPVHPARSATHPVMSLLCLHTQKNNRNCLKKINNTSKTDIKVNVPVFLCAVFFCFALFLINDYVDFQCRFLSISQINGGNVYHSSSFLLTQALNIVLFRKKKQKSKNRRNKTKNQNKKLNTIQSTTLLFVVRG